MDPQPLVADPAATTPHLTVIVVVFVDDACLAHCLARLVPQVKGRQDVDVIVTADDRIRDPGSLQRTYPEVTWRITPGNTHPAERRAAAVAVARGSHIALLEDHCLVAPSWFDAAWRACASNLTIQGGPIDKHEPDSAVAWAGYFLEFTPFMPPIDESSARASDCNTVYSAAALHDVRWAWDGVFHETTVNWSLADRGHRIVRSKDQLVYESHPQRLAPALRERVAFGRTFAGTRAARLTRPMRLVYAAGAPLLPALLTGRMGRLAAARGRLGTFLRVFPWFLLLASAWTLGELWGYLSPPHDA